MFMEMLFAAGNSAAPPPPPIPSLGAVTVSSVRSGSCPATNNDWAEVEVGWGLTNGGNPAYEIHILENGSLVGTVSSSTTFWDKSIVNYIFNSTIVPKFTSNWTYTVQLVRISDGVVVQSQVSSAWLHLYGSC
jgi:hypothetical protein